MAPFQVADEKEAIGAMKQRLAAAEGQLQDMESEQTPPLDIQQAWQAYLDATNRPDSGPRTLKGYASQWNVFLEWMRRQHPVIVRLAGIDTKIAQEYARYLLSEVKITVHRKRRKKEWDEEKVVKHAFSTNTYNKHIRTLELVFRVLAEPAGISHNPWEVISRKTENKASRRELTIEELTTICTKATGELQALLALGIYTGLRLGDCCTLRWSEVDLVRRIILRVPNKTARRKNVPVHIPIHPTLLGLLEETPKNRRTGFVLPEFAEKYRGNDSEVAKEIRHHLADCGIQVHKDGTGFMRVPSTKKRQKNVHTGVRAVVEVGFHSLRHSFVSLCRQSNAPLSVVEAIVGHSNPAMTRHYTHVGDVAAGQAVAALPAIAGVAGNLVVGLSDRASEPQVTYAEPQGPGDLLGVALKLLETALSESATIMPEPSWRKQVKTATAFVGQAKDWVNGHLVREKGQRS